MLALLGQYDKFDPAFLDVEDRVRRVSLREDGLIPVERRNRLSFADPSEKRCMRRQRRQTRFQELPASELQL